MFRSFSILNFVLAGIWIAAFTTAANSADNSPVKSAADEKQLVEILGSPLADWTFWRRNGTDFDHRIEKFDGDRFALVAGPNATILTRQTPLESDLEVRVTLRLVHPQQKDVWYWLNFGHLDPGKYFESPFGVSFILPTGADQDWFHWSARPGPGDSVTTQGTYAARALPKDRQTWPERTRTLVERNYASLTALSQRWLTIRLVLRRGSVQYYLDDRLLRESSGADVDGTGLFNMTLFEGVQLASIRIQKLPPDDARFVRVPLDHDLNSSEFGGRKITANELTAASETAVVDGVPFVLPRPDAAGRNHIDLKPSWLPCGLIDGQFDGASGDLARWPGALHRDAGRIAFRVRNARYHKLHLLALATNEADTTNRVTAQFFRASAGFPVNFSADVPRSPANSSAPGEPLKLVRVTLPLEPGGVANFSDQKWLDFELTKNVRTYRSFPDPIYYSQHAAGLPSAVHVFGVTLEKPAVDVEPQPDNFAHLWTAPETPAYSLRLKNNSAAAQSVEIATRTLSDDRQETTTRAERVEVAALESKSVRIALPVKRFGLHDVQFTITDSSGSRTESYRFAHLHPDTRERGGWEEGRGPIFGFWDWAGGHDTPGGMDRLRTMVRAGAESTNHSFQSGVDTKTPHFSDEERAFAEQHGMLSFFLAYQLSMGKHSLGVDWDATKPAEMEAALVKWLKSQPASQPTKLNRPDLAIFFAEPVLGPISYMSLPHLYGEPEYQMTAAEKAAYQNYHDQFVTAARAIKREWPRAKCLFPWGLPLFPAAFLKSVEARDLMDGPCLDVVLFERLPEMQLHQVTLSNQLWQLKQEWTRAGKTWPSFTAIEGPAVSPAAAGALTPRQEADHTIRAFLILAAYGTTRHLGWPTPFACAGSWGETHYGSGMCERRPILSPKPIFCAYATLTRQLNRMNYVKQISTGSHSVFCLQFKHYKSGDLMHVLWTIRGRRPVQFVGVAANQLVAADSMDNALPLADGATLVVDSSPCYVRGLTADAAVTLGEPDHADSEPGPHARPVAALGDGSWKLSAERDNDCEQSHPEFVRRFPGQMTTAVVDAPANLVWRQL